MIRNSIAGAVSSLVARPVNGAKLSFEIVMKKLFANGEQGFYYDPNDLSTMFQDAAENIPVTGAGQPVGLLLDKSKKLSLTPIPLPPFEAWMKSSRVTGWDDTSFTVSGTGGVGSGIILGIGKVVDLEVHYTYEGDLGTEIVIFNSSSASAASKIVASTARSGVLKATFISTSGGIYLSLRGAGKVTIHSMRAGYLEGNHAYQSTSAARPILQNNPRRIDFDAVDDKLITNLPAQLTGCTVVRSVPNVGTQILTGQTIPAPYEDNTDHCGLIVINRALTPSETSAMTAEFNKRAGV